MLCYSARGMISGGKRLLFAVFQGKFVLVNTQDWVGGSFGLELPFYDNFMYREGTGCAYVSSGRAALECLLRSMPRPRRALVPRFLCDTVLEAFARMGLLVERYGVTEQLEPILPQNASPRDFLLLVNYFGVAGGIVERAAAAWPGLVAVDATMALYCPPLPGVPTFYSPRKFGGVADGGIACAPFSLWLPAGQDAGASRAMGLLLRAEAGAEAAATAFQQAEDSLSAPPLRMCGLSRRLLKSIDWQAAAAARLRNYATLHAALAPLNRLSLPGRPPAAPFCYPFVSGIPDLRDALVDAGVVLPLFWPEVIEATDAADAENRLARKLLPLPLDQRYGEADMQRLARLIAG